MNTTLEQWKVEAKQAAYAQYLLGNINQDEVKLRFRLIDEIV